MTLQIKIPEAMEGEFQGREEDWSRLASEAFAVEGYRTDKLTAWQVRQLLGHKSRMETINFLAERGVYPNYTDESVIEDLATIESLFPRDRR